MHSEDGGRAASNADFETLANLQSVIASEFVDWEPEWSRTKSAKAASPSSGGSHLSQAETRYLQAVISRPGQASSAYPKLAGISARKAQQVRKHLVDLGYIREHVVDAAGRGRPSILLEPTAQAQGRASGAEKQP